MKKIWKEDLDGEEETLTVVHERCTRQLVLIVAKNAKYLLNPQKANLFTAGIATQNEDQKEITN